MSDAHDLGRKNLLVVDDDGPILRALTTRLSHAGYRVTTAANGTEALADLGHQPAPPDVALLDINMPGLDGFRVVEELRTRAPECRCIFLTASKDPEHKARAEELNVKLIDKPFDARHLLESIGELCA